jgi:hypothetical protein
MSPLEKQYYSRPHSQDAVKLILVEYHPPLDQVRHLTLLDVVVESFSIASL